MPQKKHRRRCRTAQSAGVDWRRRSSASSVNCFAASAVDTVGVSRWRLAIDQRLNARHCWPGKDAPPPPSSSHRFRRWRERRLALSDMHSTRKLPHTPSAAKSERSGWSRKPSLGMPGTPVCHEGLGLPLQVPLTTPGMDGFPVKQVLGPPLPLTEYLYSLPSFELQNPVGP